ncbi:MAG: hypothetical protein ACYSTY_10890, partial [Planctomycetota bacterium]
MDEQHDREDQEISPAEAGWDASPEGLEEGRSELGPPTARPRVWTAVLAWAVIVAAAAGWVTAHQGQAEAGSEQAGAIEQVMMELQSKYLVGVSQLPFTTSMDSAVLYERAEQMLNIGSVDQRLRFIVLANELAGPGEARRSLESLDELLADPPRGDAVELTESQASIRRILYALTSPGADGATTTGSAPPAALAAGDRRLLLDELGWLGRLAIAPAGIDDREQREAVLGSARTVALVVVVMFGFAGVLALGGFVGLVVVVVLMLSRVLRGGLTLERAHHAVYAETFAVWLVLFLVLQIVAGLVTPRRGEVLFFGVASLSSLVALLWPLVRGVSWRDACHDIGWTPGRRPWLEPLLGVGGYAMTLPLLAVGVMMTLFLIFVQSLVAEPPSTFAPSGGPAHPVILALTGDSWWPKIQVLLLGALVAPIVEETMFRG